MLTPSEAFGSKNVDVIVDVELLELVLLVLLLDVVLLVERLDVVEMLLEVELVVELETVLLDVMLVLVEVLLTEVLLLVVLVRVTVEVEFSESESSDSLAVEFENDPSTAFGPLGPLGPLTSSSPLRPSPRPVMLLSLADCSSSMSSTVCVMVVVSVVVTSSSLPTHCCMHRSVSSESRPYLELQETKHRQSCSSPKDALPPGNKSSKLSSSKAYW